MKRSDRQWCGCRLAWAASALLGAGAARAADATAVAGQGDSVQEVIVTAQKQPTRLLETPISIGVMTRPVLDSGQIVTLDQLSRRMPNLLIEDSLGESFQSITNRGIRTVGSQAGFESSTAIVIDGVYQARPAALTSVLYDADQVEILRGPQGALYGRNASAGVLNIVTAAPGTEPGGYVEAYGGSYSEARVRAALTGPLATDVLGRATFFWDRRDAYAQSTYPGSGAQTFTHAGGALRLDADLGGWRGKFSLRYVQLDQDANSQTDLLRVTPDLAAFNAYVIGKPLQAVDIYARRNDQDFPGYDHLKKIDGVANLSGAIGPVSVESITGASWYKDHNYIDGDNTAVSAFVIGSDEEHWQVSEEIRLRGKLSDRLDWLAGGYFFYQDFRHDDVTLLGADWATYVFGDPALAGDADVAHSHQTDRTGSGFGQLSWRPVDRLTIRIGGRIDDEDKHYDRVQPASFLSPALSATFDRQSDNWGAAASAVYKLGADADVYASVNRGTKAGGFNFGTVQAASLIPFSDERAVNYEIGARAALFDRRLWLSITGFTSRFSNLQVTSFDGTSFRTQNAAVAVSKGVEMQAIARPRPFIEFGVSAGYLDATYSKFPDAQCSATDPNYNDPACVQNLAGRPLIYAPHWSGEVWTELSGRLEGPLRWRVRADLSFRSDYYLSSDDNPNSLQGGYGLLDLHVGIENKRAGWEAAFVANNALNKNYLQAFYNYPFFQGAYTGQPGQPALYGVVVRKTF